MEGYSCRTRNPVILRWIQIIHLNDEEIYLQITASIDKPLGHCYIYIATITIPDISAAVNMLSRRNEKSREKDWNVVKRVIKYLKPTKELKLIIIK